MWCETRAGASPPIKTYLISQISDLMFSSLLSCWHVFLFLYIKAKRDTSDEQRTFPLQLTWAHYTIQVLISATGRGKTSSDCSSQEESNLGFRKSLSNHKQLLYAVSAFLRPRVSLGPGAKRASERSARDLELSTRPLAELLKVFIAQGLKFMGGWKEQIIRASSQDSTAQPLNSHKWPK